jgi:PST family polysaccharide transporter
MVSVLRSTFTLSIGSIIGILVGLGSNKVYASLLGPNGLGLLGLLQGLLGITTLVAGMGLSSGLVRLGSPLVSVQDDIGFAALRQAAWQIYLWFSGGAVFLLLIFKHPIAQSMLAGSPTWMVGVVALALLISLAAGIQIGLLNAHHHVRVLAQVTAFSSLIGSVLGIFIIWWWGSVALPSVLLTTPLSQWAVSRFFVTKLSHSSQFLTPKHVRRARNELLCFGLPFTASQIVGSAVQLGMPFLVLQQLGQQEVGYYKATILFSTAYIGFLLNALVQDFYPRLSVLRGQREAFLETLNVQQYIVMLLGGSMVIVSLSVLPFIIPLIFSPEFEPTIEILRWQLVGDVFKFVSWTLGFAILAGSSSRIYFLCELAGGIFLFAFSWWGVEVFGIKGIGIGYLIGYALYLVSMAGVVSWQFNWKPWWSNLGILLMIIGIVLLVQSQPLFWGLVLALLWMIISTVHLIGFERVMRWVKS